MPRRLKLSNFDSLAIQALHDAQTIAAGLGHSHVGIDHLVLSSIALEPVRTALGQEIDYEALSQRLAERIRGRECNKIDDEVYLEKPLLEVMKNANRRILRNRDTNLRDVLTKIIRGRGSVRDDMVEFGFTRAAIRKADGLANFTGPDERLAIEDPFWIEIRDRLTGAEEEQEVELPALGKITDYEARDGLGVILLESGIELYFGPESLRGIEPDHKGAVLVHEVREQRGLGACAYDVKDAEFARLSVEEQKLAVYERIGSLAEPRGHTGWVAIPFDGLPPMVDSEWKEIAESIGRDCHCDFGEKAHALSGTIEIDGHHMLVEIVLQPLTLAGIWREELAARHSSYVAITPTTVSPRVLRAQRGDHMPDPWGPSGYARIATQLARALAQRSGCSFVQLSTSASLKPVDRFIMQCGPPGDFEHRGWEAWVDGGFDDETTFHLFGLYASGLPELLLRFEPHTDPDLAIEAGLNLSDQMVRSNSEPEPGDSFVTIHDGERYSWRVSSYESERDTVVFAPI